MFFSSSFFFEARAAQERAHLLVWGLAGRGPELLGSSWERGEGGAFSCFVCVCVFAVVA